VYLIGLTIGLFGSFHCLGMCGPIAFALPIGNTSSFQKVVAVSLYHLGRISSYGTIGLLVSLVGQGFFLLEIQDVISIGLGILLLMSVILPKIFNSSRWAWMKTMHQWVLKRLKNVIQVRNTGQFFLLGVFNGLLPCGFVYVALLYAIVQSTIHDTVIIMMLFGLGTVPVMSIAVFWRYLLPMRLRNKWQKAVPIFLSVLAILLILRGLRLNIPMISPSSTTTEGLISSESPCIPYQQ